MLGAWVPDLEVMTLFKLRFFLGIVTLFARHFIQSSSHS